MPPIIGMICEKPTHPSSEAEPRWSSISLRRSRAVLHSIVGFLDDYATLVEQVRQDLLRGLKNPNTGRGGITPSQALRSLILMRVKNWDYRELRERINDGYTPARLYRFRQPPCAQA